MTATEMPVTISNAGIFPNKRSVHHSKVPITTINITPTSTATGITVIIGVILSALSFAWESASKIYIEQSQNDKGDNVYKVNGTLFFASKEHFHQI
jgi:SulP family sulfate permease